MTFARTLLALSLFALAARAAENPPAKAPAPQGQKPQGAGGDGPKAKTASMIVEGEEPGDDPTPPFPQGAEKLAIGDYIRDNSGDVRECYARRLQERPTLQGKLVVRFDIGAHGRVIGATADGIQDRELIACVVAVVRKWEFERPSSGGKLRVAYPFKFEPQPAR